MSNLDRFTKNALRVLTVAEKEAKGLNHNYIGTEHLLLALKVVKGCTAEKFLGRIGISQTNLRKVLLAEVGKGERQPFGSPTLAPRVKEVIQLGVSAAQELQHEKIGTEHLLLGLLEEGKGMGGQLLSQLWAEGNSMSPFRLIESEAPPVDISGAKERLVKMLKEGPAPPYYRYRLPGEVEHFATLDESSRKSLIEDAAQEERNRIARDLHDSIKQQIFNIKVSAAAVQERWESDGIGAKAALADAQESAQAAMVEMNALLMQLSPEPLEKTGLIEALREQCQALAFRTGAQVNTAFGKLPPDELLPTGTRISLFRIAQEALANVARHARANHVRLRLDSLGEQQMLLLEVSDDGQGFEPGMVPKGMGLTNMNERTEYLNGTIEITSQQKEGTTVTVQIPLTLAASDDDVAGDDVAGDDVVAGDADGDSGE